MKQLTHIKQATWSKVFARWQAEEGSDPSWDAFAKDVKGWENWAAWRGYQSNKIGAAERTWEIYRIDAPAEFFQEVLLGPYPGWQNQFDEKLVHSFADIVRDRTDWVNGNNRIAALRENFPVSAQFIGLILERTGQIMLYEGHHRAAAIVAADAAGEAIRHQEPLTIALTRISAEDEKLLKDLLEQGTHNPST